MTDRWVIGLDPGQNGGIGIICPRHQFVWAHSFRDKTDQEIYHLILPHTLVPCHIFLEKVGARPQQGVVSSFNFGERYGFLKGIATTLQTPLELVPPQRWLLALGLGNRKLDYSQRKKANRQLAQQWFPTLNPGQDEADAILIAEYGHRTLYRR